MNWVKNLSGAGILGGLVWWHSTDAFVDALRMVTVPALLAALAIGLLTTLFSAWRWCLVARRLHLALALPAAVADYYRALFLNAVLPAGVLGDVHRAVSHGRDAGDVGRGVRAVVLERAAGQLVIIVAGLVVLVTQPRLFSALAADAVNVMTLVLCAVAAAVAAVAVARRRWGRAVARAVSDARRVLLARDTWPGVALLSAAALAGYIALFLVAARAVGVTAPLPQLVPLVVFALLVMGLPVNIGGWGPREAAAAIAFGAAGLGSQQGLAVAIVYGVLTFVASLPGAAVLLVRAVTRRAATAPVPDAEPLAPERLEVTAELFDERREKVPALAGRGQ
jgi:uncharacterized membrane protein YbhN (UPF0104 family)